MSRDQNRALVLVAALGLVMLAALFWRSSERRASAPPATDGADVALSQPPPAPVQRDEFEALQRELRALQSELDMLRQVPRSEAASGADLSAAPPSALAPAANAGAPTPHEALALYVRSFDHDGAGLEYYRLIVQAHAKELAADILVYVSSPRSSLALRLRLIEILGDTRLRGDTRVLRVLAVLLEDVEEQRLPLASAAALVHLTREPEAHWSRPTGPARRSRRCASPCWTTSCGSPATTRTRASCACSPALLTKPRARS